MTTYQYSIQILPRDDIPVFSIEQKELKEDDDEYEDIHEGYEAVAEMHGFLTLLVKNDEGKTIGSVGFDVDGWGSVVAETWISMEVAKQIALKKCQELRDAFAKAVEKINE